MTATAHALAGVAIAAKIQNPALAVPIAILSHLVLDQIPHWDTARGWRKKSTLEFFTESGIDFTIGIILSFFCIVFLFPNVTFLYGLVIILASQALDWIMTPYIFLRIEAFKWAYIFGSSTNRKLGLPWGAVTQIVTITLILTIAKIV